MNSVQPLWGLVGTELLVFGVFWLFVPQPSRVGNHGMRSLAWFNLCLGAGLILIALRHRLPGLITDVGADGLILLALALLWRGSAVQFTGKSSREPVLIAGLTFVLIFVAAWAWPEQNGLRLILLYPLLAAMVLRAAWFAVPVALQPSDPRARARNLVRVVASVSALWLLVRAMGAVLWGWGLDISVSALGTVIMAYGALIAATLVNLALSFIVVRSLVRRLESLANRDAMTGLLNRRALWDGLHRRWQAWQRSRTRFALLSLDVDHFKSINDVFGHATGDAVVQAVAKVLSTHARPSDDVVRAGGDEFVVVLDAVTDEPTARAFAERLRMAVQAMVVPPVLGTQRVTISVGLAVVEQADVQAADTLARSDQALYQAKAAGRNCVCSNGAVVAPRP